MFTIQFMGQPIIKNLNLRKEGDDNDRVLAVDVKLVGEVRSNVLDHLFGASPGETFKFFFWSQPPIDAINEAMMPGGKNPVEPLKTYSMEDITVSGTWRNRLVTLGKTQVTADVGKVHVTPLSGLKMAIALQIQIENPPKALLDHLVARVSDTVNCLIESQPELPLGAAKVAKS